ncbi:hypothetical protein EES41_35340 [Streptomyces sp. ADI95-16]|nr:hypothetical protein EES41_35340 [Streptomyces sp. ADI95-16]
MTEIWQFGLGGRPPYPRVVPTVACRRATADT